MKEPTAPTAATGSTTYLSNHQYVPNQTPVMATPVAAAPYPAPYPAASSPLPPPQPIPYTYNSTQTQVQYSQYDNSRYNRYQNRGFKSGYAQADRSNGLMRIVGLTGLVAFAISIALCTYVGAGPQIGSIIGGLVCCIVGLAISFHHSRQMYQIRGTILVLFSALCLGCDISAFQKYATLQACVTAQDGSFYSSYDYFGNSDYYGKAATCGDSDSFAFDDCDCVNTSNDCIVVSFTSSCQRILDHAPGLANVLMIMSIIMMVCSVVSLWTTMNYVYDDKLSPLSAAPTAPNNDAPTLQSFPPPVAPVAPAVYLVQPVVATPID